VSQLSRRDPDCLALSQDVPDATPAARLSLDAVRADLAALRQDLGAVVKLGAGAGQARRRLGAAARGLRGRRCRALSPQAPPSGPSSLSAGTPPLHANARTRLPSSGADTLDAIAASLDTGGGGGSAAAAEGASPPGASSSSSSPACEALADFVGRAQEELEALGARADACRASFGGVLEYLAEDPGSECAPGEPGASWVPRRGPGQ